MRTGEMKTAEPPVGVMAAHCTPAKIAVVDDVAV
jgi:hypothetical protein